MKQWIVRSVVLIVFFGTMFLIYRFSGVAHYRRALTVINEMSEDAKKKAWDEFSGTDPRGAQRGIYAGTMLGRVWVWSTDGLRSFITDKDTVYSFFDGCWNDVKEGIEG